MGKGNRNRENRSGQTTARQTTFAGGMMGFCLPDTPDNRDLIRMVTGQSPETFINEDGMLDSFQAEKSTHK